MSTTINVTVGGSELLARAHQQTYSNRLNRVEQDADTDIEVKGQQEQQRLSPPRVGSLLPVKPARREAAARRSDELMYLVISNVNAAKDDNFEISVINGNNQIKLDGIADFTADDEVTTYLWLSRGLSLDAFLKSKAGKQINNEITAYASSSPTYKSPFLLPRLGLTSGDNARIFMKNVKANYNGNYGYLYAGFSKAIPSTHYEWSAGNFDSIYIDVTWE